MKKQKPEQISVSIIVPLHWGLRQENYNRFLNDFKKYLELKYNNYEIILVTDKPTKLPFKSQKIKYLVTYADHATSPAEKRDFALPQIKNEICAFIDDDAYPVADWISNAVRHFQHPLIIAVGGPGVTPPGDNFWQKLGGAILESKYCSGQLLYRYYKINNWLSVDDYPAYNLFIRTKTLKKVGGFNSTFYYGEDTRVCIELVKYGKILYDPEVLVYHHRRAFPEHHLKQIWNTGVHRGFFVKAFPVTSKRWFYFIPITLTLGLFGLVGFSIYNPSFFAVPTIVASSMIWFLASASIRNRGKDNSTSFLGGLGVIVSHIAYGTGFMRGLLLKKLLR
ncbi:MAG: glycosyltransferase [Candidatus Levybacteria bacterium]|nr:glycosyltransferase [Candidatus Levybacteria bacterium]